MAGENKCSSSSAVKVADDTTRLMLTRCIMFHAAARIQERYLEKYNHHYRDELHHFLEFLGKTAVSRKNISREKLESFSAAGKYGECAARIIGSNKSYWTIKKILDDYDIPGYAKHEGDVLVNPYVFLPESPGSETFKQTFDMMTLLSLFYTAVLMEEDRLFEKTAPLLLEKVKQEYPGDLVLFENMVQLYKNDTSRLYDAGSLAYYYLVSGNIDNRFRLTEAHHKKVRYAADFYDQNFYHKSYISVNEFTLRNRVFMWLAARRHEQDGNIHKANVYIKTTFDNEVLRNIKKFHPNHQVYLYATIRLAVRIHSPKMYRYVYGALDPLTKSIPGHTEYKELLKMQLLQLMD